MDIKRIITGSLLALLIIILFLNIPAGHPISLLILLAICGLAIWEFYTLLIAGGLASSRKWGYSDWYNILHRYLALYAQPHTL